MRPITFPTAAGSTSAPIPLDIYVSPFSVTVSCEMTGGATATLQYTLDDVFAPNYVPATGVWYTRADMSAQATNKDVTFIAPVRAVRVQAGGTGSVTTKIVQAGLK